MTDAQPPPQRLNVNGRRQFTLSGREVDFFVFVICTDRGQHKRVLLSTARRELDGSHGMNHAHENFAPPKPDADPESAYGRDSYIFWCPRCSRTPQIKREAWWHLIDGAGRAELIDLDISLLPS